MRTYILYISNLSCPSCVDELQDALRKLQVVKKANLDYVQGTLEVMTSDLKQVIATIKKIEPDSNISQDEDSLPKEHFFSKEFFLLLGLFIVFIFAGGIEYIVDNMHGENSFSHKDIIDYVIWFILAIIYLIAGRNVFKGAYQSIKSLSFFDENMLMLIASIAAIILGHYAEACAIMLFFSLGDYLESRAVAKSKNSIKSLIDKAPKLANLVTSEGKVEKVSPKDVAIGEVILIRVGDMVPLDCEIIEGTSHVDRSNLNGESLPAKVVVGDSLEQGVINLYIPLKAKVTKKYEDSRMSKIVELVRQASDKKAKSERFITVFARYYTPIVVVVCLIVAFGFPFIFGGTIGEWVYRALVVLMVSCPCALVISVPLAYFGAIGVASKYGILIKASKYLEALNGVKFIAFDKTGTLTNGRFSIVDSKIIESSDIPKGYETKKAFLLDLASNIQAFSNHPLAKAFRYKLNALNVSDVKEVAGRGIKARYEDKDVLLGNASFLEENGIEVHREAVISSIVYMAVDKKLEAIFYLNDELKVDTLEAFRRLRKLGIKNTYILSGDSEAKVKEIADELHSNYSANLSPEQKEQKYLELQKQFNVKSAFVGDGINDAIVLKRSDVGIGMNNGSDVSKESADVILTHSLITLPLSIKIARKTRTIVWQNIIFALVVKLIFIVLGLMGVANIWEAVFGDVGVALIALLNSMRVNAIEHVAYKKGQELDDI
ncbi:heavy metal translocating P-type ATPase [Helicobacter sp. 11S02629-2]|uniref:heavy metal translocating P-type ATPase n=1 Tax=Helicobacter sp. 11S02629-2 TaxID=1476195 RepID=UPI000BCF2887|nr:heavy metal translocating P-type ATPase [Helicobacter sp. 11S02629-2]PAF43262.1 cadmium-translocating P-type ATPase [Helicobacter sp. 11S02629-2]